MTSACIAIGGNDANAASAERKKTKRNWPSHQIYAEKRGNLELDGRTIVNGKDVNEYEQALSLFMI